MEAVKSSLASGGNLTSESINNILESFSGDYQPFSIENQLAWVDICFGKYEVIEILEALAKLEKSSDPNAAKWAADQKTEIEKMSPTSVFLTLEALKRARKLPLTGCLKMEYLLSESLVVCLVIFLESLILL